MEDKLNGNKNCSQDQSKMEEKGRIVVKVILSKAPPPSEAAAAIAPAEEINSHCCKECGKSFSSGKALGGHMSSAHVQANKEHPSKKLKSRSKNPLKDGGATAENVCTLCGKDFRSPKSLFGHMRCHPERFWRGMEPPAAAETAEEHIGDPPEDSSSSSSSEEEEGFESGDQIDAVAVGRDFSLSWAMRAKRGGRGVAVRPTEVAAIDSPPPSPPRDVGAQDNELLVAQQLMKLFKDIPMEKGENKGLSWPELDNMDRACGSKKQKRECFGPENEWPSESIKKPKIRDCKSVPKLKICEREDSSDGGQHFRRKIWNNDNGKGVNMDCEGQWKGKSQENYDTKTSFSRSSLSSNSSKIGFPTGIDSNATISYPINQKQDPNNHGRAKKTQVVVAEEDENTVSPSQPIPAEGKVGTTSNGGGSSPKKKYYCEICDKSYPTHQAFGGHKSSHNKVKITIINSCDMTYGSTKSTSNARKRKKGNLGSEKSGIPDENKSHICKKCDKGFASAKALGGHKRSHANDEAKVVLDIDLNKEPVEEDGIGEDGKDAIFFLW